MQQKTAKGFPLPQEQVEKLLKLIKEKKLYQQNAAAILGVNQGRISELKNGKRKGLIVKNLLPY